MLVHLIFWCDSACWLSSSWLWDVLLRELCEIFFLFFCLLNTTSLLSLSHSLCLLGINHEVIMLLLRRQSCILGTLWLTRSYWRLIFLTVDFEILLLGGWRSDQLSAFRSNSKNWLNIFSHLYGFFRVNIVILLLFRVVFIQ